MKWNALSAGTTTRVPAVSGRAMLVHQYSGVSCGFGLVIRTWAYRTGESGGSHSSTR
ncbi:hypothetical protein Cs7R123_48990 [Catellatospora sp. TT07R-123]|nr:hypothetical protein [Catellatospora sp. TT07R-123]GHJ47557.1 hypothetical protein Cs7R123_48990 [Catellatospora sp. TT07R-123]